MFQIEFASEAIGDFRIFYDVDTNYAVVKIEAIGHKRGSTLLIRGKEYKL